MRSELHLDPSYVQTISENEWKKKFSFKLDKLMRANSVTNSKLADAVGLNQATIREYRIGLRTPNAYYITLICKALGCTTSALMDLC